MTDWPCVAVADCRFAVVNTVGMTSHGDLCQQESHRGGRAVSRVILACHQSDNLIVYAKELA